MVVRNYKEAILWFRTFKCPSKISFDHDLGIGENGYDILKWLFDYDLENDYIK